MRRSGYNGSVTNIGRGGELLETFDLNTSFVGFSRVAQASVLRLGAEVASCASVDDLGHAVTAFESIVSNDVYPKSLWATRLRAESVELSKVLRGKKRKTGPLPDFVPIEQDGLDEAPSGGLSLNYVSALSLDVENRDIHSVSSLSGAVEKLEGLSDRVAASVLLDGVFVSPTMLREQLPSLSGLKESAFIFSSGGSESTLSVWRDVVDLYKFCVDV